MDEPDELSPEEKAANVERNHRVIAEQWAKHEARTLELEELKSLPAPTPAQLRRIAELHHSLHGGGVALVHWRIAAEAGDEDAKDVVETWEAELRGDCDDPLLTLLRGALLMPTEEQLAAAEVGELRQQVVKDLRKFEKDVEDIRGMNPEDFG